MRGRMQRALRGSIATAFAVLVVGGGVAACTSTVNGTGVALGTGVPTAASSASGFPSASASETPSSGSTGSLSAEPNPGGGFSVTYPDGHFKAIFPAEPESQSQPGNLGPVSFTVYIATVQGRALGAAEDFTPHIGPSDYDATLRAAVTSFVSSSGLTLESQSATTFHSFPGRTANLTSPGGDPFRMVVFMYQGSRLYILFGESGDVYNTLTDSFEVLP